jgi:hypothetical protein
VLLKYAANEWLEHIRRCAQHLRPDLLENLRHIISTFTEVRESSFFQAESQNRYHADRRFQAFLEWPNVYEFLISMDDFIWKERGGLLEHNSEYLFSGPAHLSW